MVLRDLLKRVLSGIHDYGDTSFAMRNKVFSIYTEAITSQCTQLVRMLQVLLMLISYIAGKLLFGVDDSLLLIYMIFRLFDVNKLHMT